MRRPVRAATSLTGLDAVLRVLVDGGWEMQRATRAVLLVESYALGAALTAVGGGLADDAGQLKDRPVLAAALRGPHAGFRFTEDDFGHGLDTRSVLVEVGRRALVGGQQDMITDVALDLAAAAAPAPGARPAPHPAPTRNATVRPSGPGRAAGSARPVKSGCAHPVPVPSCPDAS